MKNRPAHSSFNSNGSSQLWPDTKDKVGPLNVGDNCMAGEDCGDTGSETRIYPYCFYWLLKPIIFGELPCLAWI